MLEASTVPCRPEISEHSESLFQKATSKIQACPSRLVGKLKDAMEAGELGARLGGRGLSSMHGAPDSSPAPQKQNKKKGEDHVHTHMCTCPHIRAHITCATHTLTQNTPGRGLGQGAPGTPVLYIFNYRTT